MCTNSWLWILTDIVFLPDYQLPTSHKDGSYNSYSYNQECGFINFTFYFLWELVRVVPTRCSSVLLCFDLMVGVFYHDPIHYYFLDKVDLDVWAHTYLPLDEPLIAP